MVALSDAEIPSLLFDELGAAPSTPASGFWRLYTKSTGLFVVDDAGTEYGPLAATGSGISSTIVDAKGDIIAATAADTVARLAVGTNGQVLTAASGQSTGLQWTTPSTGGITQSYVGKNAIGATTENMAVRKTYMKKITLATAGYLGNIEFYMQAAINGPAGMLSVGVWADNSGSPRELIGYNFMPSDSLTLDYDAGAGTGEVARWFGVPIGKWLVAGDYWIGGGDFDATVDYNIYKDTGTGADRHMTPAAAHMDDAGFTTVTTTTDDYSIRGTLLR